ncbi:MAG: hypothetical protein M1816_004358 [Peltula sp. TS41687]|nr:MAG: hypothetical protein M1816_004358 [Peltula sp. TS41687]
MGRREELAALGFVNPDERLQEITEGMSESARAQLQFQLTAMANIKAEEGVELDAGGRPILKRPFVRLLKVATSTTFLGQMTSPEAERVWDLLPDLVEKSVGETTQHHCIELGIRMLKYSVDPHRSFQGVYQMEGRCKRSRLQAKEQLLCDAEELEVLRELGGNLMQGGDSVTTGPRGRQAYCPTSRASPD